MGAYSVPPSSWTLMRCFGWFVGQVGGGVEISIGSALETWEKVKRQVPITKGLIAPMVKIQAFATRAQIAAFEAKVIDYSNSVNGLSFWRYSTGVDEARLELDEASVRQHAMRKECKRMEHIATVFELTDQVRPQGTRAHEGILFSVQRRLLLNKSLLTYSGRLFTGR